MDSQDVDENIEIEYDDNGKNEKSCSDEVCGLDDDYDDTITIIVEDEKFIIPKKVAFMSTLIKTTFENDNNEEKITLNYDGLTVNIFKKIIEYMSYYHDKQQKEIEQPLKSKNMIENVGEWNANYIDIDDNNVLFALTNSSNYLHIEHDEYHQFDQK